MKRQLVHASTFSGIGAPDIAAEVLGWRNAFHCEINDWCRQILDFYFPNAESYGDITKQDFTKWGGQIDVLTGGFPCQPFSYAGRRGGAEDDRYLWPAMLRCITEIKPTWFIGENVPGITTMVEQGGVVEVGCQTDMFNEENNIRRYEYNQPFTIERICKDVESIGYEIQPILIPACGVGAPHRRDRIFFIARRNKFDTDTRFIRCKQTGIGTSMEAEAPSECIKDNIKDDATGYAEGTTTDTEVMHRNGNGLDNGKDKESRLPKLGSGNSEEVGGRSIADTNIVRMERPSNNHRQCNKGEGRQIAECVKPNGVGDRKRIGQEYDVADTLHTRCVGANEPRCDKRAWSRIWRNITRHYSPHMRRQYERFPTISPIYRGNDGFPFDVDNLTISFGKWKRESLKAYGNAIVVPVIYEIFKFIEEIENERPAE